MADNLPSMAWLRENATGSIENGDLFREAFDAALEERGYADYEDLPEDEELLDEVKEVAWASLKHGYSDFKRIVRGFTNPIRIFRAVDLVDVTALRTDALGVYWTWDKGSAESYWADRRTKKKTFIIEALVDPAAVDWGRTLIANMSLYFENEVTLLEGAPVHVVAVYDVAAGEDVVARGAFDARANPRRTRRH
jgi:cation transport regulator ChaB